MLYCLAIDIAKGKSTVGLFSNEGEILITPKDVLHNKESLAELNEEIKSFNLPEVHVIMESTSIYHLPVESYFKAQNYDTIVINPIIAKDNKRNLRKTKTDKEDCINLSEIFFKGLHNKQTNHNTIYTQMQFLSRQIQTYEEIINKLKARLKMLLTLTFPEYEELFSKDTIYQLNTLYFIGIYPHSEMVLKKRVDTLHNDLIHYRKTSGGYYLDKVKKIKEAAKNSLPAVTVDSVVCSNITAITNDLISLLSKQQNNKMTLIDMGSQTPFFSVYRTFYGVGELTAAYFCAELKDITRFKTEKQLYASCGLDPTIVQSGKTINFHGPISKRGNKNIRKILFNTIMTMIKMSAHAQPDNEIYVYYRKKRNEGKHHYVAVIDCTTKLLRKIFYRCKDSIK